MSDVKKEEVDRFLEDVLPELANRLREKYPGESRYEELAATLEHAPFEAAVSALDRFMAAEEAGAFVGDAQHGRGIGDDPNADAVDEFRLRTWARGNYLAPSQRTAALHPFALDEMRRIDESRAVDGDEEDDGDDFDKGDAAAHFSEEGFRAILGSIDSRGAETADDWKADAVLVTDRPVEVFDFSRYEVVPEVLLISGMEIRGGDGRIPLLDAHRRDTMEAVLGSVDRIESKGWYAGGRLRFAESSKRTFAKVRDGHLTDVSAGYQVRKKTYVPAGKRATIQGREFAGPLNVVTDWQLREVSLVPIGADSLAKIGRAGAALPPDRSQGDLLDVRSADARYPPSDLQFDDSTGDFVLWLTTLRISGRIAGREIRALASRAAGAARGDDPCDPERIRALDNVVGAIVKDARRKSPRHATVHEILSTRDSPPLACRSLFLSRGGELRLPKWPKN